MVYYLKTLEGMKPKNKMPQEVNTDARQKLVELVGVLTMEGVAAKLHISKTQVRRLVSGGGGVGLVTYSHIKKLYAQVKGDNHDSRVPLPSG